MVTGLDWGGIPRHVDLKPIVVEAPMSIFEFEAPVFKRLPKNDTGQAVGHQAGFVVPKPLGDYFPVLPPATVEAPAPSTGIRAILVSDGVARGTIDTVYQHQTWGGTRPPERRVTANLKPLLQSAKAGDFLLIERNLEDDHLYRFTLVRQGSEQHAEVLTRTGGKGWGTLQGTVPPVTNGQIEAQKVALSALSLAPFAPFELEAQKHTVQRIARSRAFRSLVCSTYDQLCAMCGGGLVNAVGKSEVEAAHIIGRGAKGADDVRNGLALCRAHHWAFDQGMVCVNASYQIVVKPKALAIASNAPLLIVDGKSLRAPSNANFSAHADALAWHRTHVFDTTHFA